MHTLRYVQHQKEIDKNNAYEAVRARSDDIAVVTHVIKLLRS